jgi:uncharacterized protein (TIGR02646 family)
MQIVTGNNCREEHFLPQSMFPEYQTDYYNLYLACNGSSGKAKETQHCDVRKSDELIAKLIGFRRKNGKSCDDLFQYNDDGLIAPIADKSADLLQIRKEVILAIETLNLNAFDLREARRKFINTTKPIIDKASRPQLEKMKADYETALRKKFAGVALYLINKRLRSLNNGS